MFAEIVAIEQRLGHAFAFGIEGCGVKGHPCDGFEDDGIVRGVCGCFTPAEGCVAGNEHGGHGIGVKITEAADDGDAGVVDVIAVDVVGGEFVCDRNGAIEIVGVGGAVGGDAASGLGPGSGVFRMRVHDRADSRELAVEEQMRGEVRRRAEIAFDDFAVEIGDDHVLGLHGLVREAAGLDGDEASLAVDAADVAESVKNEAAADQFEVGLKDLGAEIVKHGVLPLWVRKWRLWLSSSY